MPTGKPFLPATNVGTATVSWTAATGQDWVAIVGPANGMLNPGEAIDVVVSLTGNANLLPDGGYTADIVFTNTTSGIVQSRSVFLSVSTPPDGSIYWFPMNIDPGWSTEGQWQFGRPLGGGSACGDPASGINGGLYVYGYNLAGDYANGIPPYSLTTTALDCTGYKDVVLSFYRWLGVESACVNAK